MWCWRRLLRVSWTARRSNQSILKEISPEYSLEGLMLKLNLQCSGHLMWRANSLEKPLTLGKTEGKRRRQQQRMKWLDSLTDSMTWIWANSKKQWRTEESGVLQSMESQRVGHDSETEQQQHVPWWFEISVYWKMITTRSLINSWIILDCKTLTVHIITFNYLQASWWNLMLWLACIGFLGGSDGKESAHNAEDLDSISGSGRSSREEKWQPTPVFLSGEFHGRAWWTTVRGVTKSRTPLWLIFFLIFMVKTWRTFPIKFIWLVQITLLSF